MKNKVSEEEKKETEKYLTTTAKQSSIVFVGRFLGYILGFLMNFILARLFGPKIVGQYSLVKTTVDLVVIFTVFGLNNGIVKYASRYINNNEENKLFEVLKISFIYAGLFSVLGSVIIFVFRGFIANKIFNDNELVIALSYGAWLVIPFTLRRIFSGIYRSYKDLKDYIIPVEVYRRFAIVIFLLILYILEFKHISYVIGSFLLIEISNLSYLAKNIKNIGLNFKKIFAFELKNKEKSIKNQVLSYSSMVILIHFMHLILNKIDRVMLGIFSTSEVVGVYNTAASVTILLTFFLSSSNMIFSPIISELYSKNKLNMLQSLYSTITKWLIILTVPIMINIYFFSEIIMGFFGEEYLIGASTLFILGLGQLINTAVGANGYIMNMCGFEKLLLINDIFMAIINIILNVVMIPKYGMLGAAIATAISIASFNLFKLLQVKYYLDIIPFNRRYFHIFINVIIISLFTFFIKGIYSSIIIVFINTAFSMIVSFIISYLFKDELDKFVFNKFKNKFRRLFS